MYDLVAAAAPDQRRVFKILHVFAIDQYVDEIDHLHLRGVEFIELVAGPHPDVFSRTLSANALHQLQNIRHVLWMQRIAAGERDPLTLDSRIVQIGNDLVFHLFGKWLAGIEPPGAFVIATGTFMHAP